MALAQTDTRSLEERAFEQRSFGLHSYRMATPLWYGFAMGVMAKWRVKSVATVESAQAVLTIPSAFAAPDAENARDWVKRQQDDGWGIVDIPESDTLTVMVRTKSASVASDITGKSDSAFVLNEPRDGWTDTSIARLLALPVFFVVGLITMLAVAEGLRT